MKTVPWDDYIVSLSYTKHRRTGLSLTQPNDSPWAQSYTYDGIHRLTNLTSTAGSFASEYYSGASTLLRKLTQPSGAFNTNTYDSVARLLSTTLKNSGRATLNAHAYTVNAAGQTRTAGDYVDYTYDAAGQSKTASGKESGGSTNRWQEQFGYAYDADVRQL